MNTSIFNNNWAKKNFIYLQLIFLSLSIFEIFNIGLLIPFLYSIIDFENILSFRIFTEIIEIFKLDFSNQQNFIINLGLIIIIFFFINAFLQIVSLIYLSNFIEQIGIIMQKKIYNKFISLDYQNYTESSSSNFYNLMINEIMRYQNGYLNSLININQKIYTLIILSIALSFINFFFVLIITSIFVSLYVLFFIFFKNYISKISKEISKLNQNRISLLKSTFELFDLIKIKNLRNFFEIKLNDLILKIKGYNVKAYIFASLPRQLLESFFVITIVVFSILIFKFGDNLLASKLQELIIISAISVKLIPILNLIYNNYIKARANKFALTNIDIFLSFKSNLEINKKEGSSLNKDVILNNDYIEINNLKFSYKEKNIFPKKNNKNYKIKMGEINLIYGESGSGKSTLVKILVGLINPMSMILKTKNKEYEGFNSNLSRVASYIPQKIYLYPSTIEENISLGDTRPNINKIINCLKKAEIHEFFQNLKNSKNALLSEDLLDISGGQIQRIGLARALYDDTPIIILDETLSSVDDENKLKIIKTLEKLSNNDNKTFLIITHDKTLYKDNYNLINIEK
jgi:ABC-type multidrug transport system fused ATPase/permease subunit